MRPVSRAAHHTTMAAAATTTAAAATASARVRPLKYTIQAKWNRARVSLLELPHGPCDTPMFMPVGTQGTIKSLTPDQVLELGCPLILGNTYHLGHRPGPEVLEAHGGLHSFMHWPRNLLTDSGGFQMVSLLELAEVTEQGVRFSSPHDGSEMMLTPEHSIHIQNAIGADIIMMLDDVVHSKTTGPRVEEAMHRTIRWLDRCIAAHKRPHDQSLFPIVQGGLDENLRRACIAELIKRDTDGYAIGGLSGGEDKASFWRMVSLCCRLLPEDRPRYVMGVGYPVDLVVVMALGCDMADCVWPTRCARFGIALTDDGELELKQAGVYAQDLGPLDPDCSCRVCRTYTRSYIHSLASKDPAGCTLISYHNIAYQMRLMSRIRSAIMDKQFPAFVQTFMDRWFARSPEGIPAWVVDAMADAGMALQTGKKPAPPS